VSLQYLIYKICTWAVVGISWGVGYEYHCIGSDQVFLSYALVTYSVFALAWSYETLCVMYRFHKERVDNWICETSDDKWFKVQATVSMVNASVTYPAQLTMSLVYFIYLTSMRPEDVLKFSITSNIVVTRGEEGHQYQEYYARSTSYYATSNVDLEKHLAATKPSFFLFIHMMLIILVDMFVSARPFPMANHWIGQAYSYGCSYMTVIGICIIGGNDIQAFMALSSESPEDMDENQGQIGKTVVVCISISICTLLWHLLLYALVQLRQKLWEQQYAQILPNPYIKITRSHSICHLRYSPFDES